MTTQTAYALYTLEVLTENCTAVYLYGNTYVSGYFYTQNGQVTCVDNTNGFLHTFAGSFDRAIEIITAWENDEIA
jgi:hypothetical protein